MHPLGSPYVRDQLSTRSILLNERRPLADRAYVLYWMQSTHRLEDNWALRLATIEADRVGKPLIIGHMADSDGAHSSARFDTFVLQGARELASRAESLGFAYRYLTNARAGDGDASLERLARGAVLIVTDQHATQRITPRTAALAARMECRVIAVDSIGIVPVACFPREEYSPRTFRPKYMRFFAHAMEPVEDRAPKRAVPASLLATLPDDAFVVESRGRTIVSPPLVGVAPATQCITTGGLSAARERLATFSASGLAHYRERRSHPSDQGGTSRLSAHLRYGMLSPREVVAHVQAVAPSAELDAFIEEVVVLRELATNFCWHRPHYDTLDALPDWATRTIAAHVDDPRDVVYTLAELEGAATHDALWNAAQTELVETGFMHPVMRMLWGKSVVAWAPSCADALAWLLHLNNKYALDGRDASSYAGVQWCLGKFDRPFVERPVWGTIRSMSLTRAHAKHDVAEYITRWQASALAA